MKIKNNRALAGIDIVIAVMAITIFSTLIVSMMHSNVMENAKLKKETEAMIYITEIFENIGIENYNNLPVGNYEDITNNSYDESIEKLIPTDIEGKYLVNLVITDQLEGVSDKEDILKKVQITLTYDLVGKRYNCSMERMKIKE